MNYNVRMGYVLGVGLILTSIVPYITTGMTEIAVGHGSAGLSVLIATGIVHVVKSQDAVGASA